MPALELLSAASGVLGGGGGGEMSSATSSVTQNVKTGDFSQGISTEKLLLYGGVGLLAWWLLKDFDIL